MNTKKFFFWSGIGIVVCVGSYLVIQFFKKVEENRFAEHQAREAKKLAETPRREAGFHAIAKDHATAAA